VRAKAIPPANVPRRHTEAFSTVTPTRWTVFLRTFIPYQVIRFAVINLKMLQMIRMSHANHPRQDGAHR
jgi:hypothetical protein